MPYRRLAFSGCMLTTWALGSALGLLWVFAEDATYHTQYGAGLLSGQAAIARLAYCAVDFCLLLLVCRWLWGARPEFGKLASRHWATLGVGAAVLIGPTAVCLVGGAPVAAVLSGVPWLCHPFLPAVYVAVLAVASLCGPDEAREDLLLAGLRRKRSSGSGQ